MAQVPAAVSGPCAQCGVLGVPFVVRLRDALFFLFFLYRWGSTRGPSTRDRRTCGWFPVWGVTHEAALDALARPFSSVWGAFLGVEGLGRVAPG